MSRFLDLIDKYKFGILAALTSYVVIFMYLKMDSYQRYYPFEPFHDGSYVELTKEEIQLTQDNIMMPENFRMEEVKNLIKDRNDPRETSYDDYMQNMSAADVEQSVYDLEKEMYEEAGGAEERERIKQMMEARREQEQEQNQQQNTGSNNQSDKTYAGRTLVEWELSGRKPHQNNDWYVRNPGYTCGYGASGVIVIDMKVNKNGNVISAAINSGMSSGNSCMMEQALKYAKMSRFNYTGSAPSSQSGRIYYTFVSQ